MNGKNDIYNNHLSKAPQLVERAFGMMISRWKILVSPLHLNTIEMREMSSKFAICCTTFVYATDYPKKIVVNKADQKRNPFRSNCPKMVLSQE